MKKQKMSEDKQVNIFIIAFIVFIVVSITAVFYFVAVNKTDEEESTKKPLITSSTQAESAVNATATQQSTAAAESTSSAELATGYTFAKTGNAAVDAENERYANECNEINKRYDDEIAVHQAEKDSIMKAKGEKLADYNNQLSTYQDNLKELKAKGAPQGMIDKCNQDINACEEAINVIQKEIDDADNAINRCEAQRRVELANAEKVHNEKLAAL